MDTIRFYALMIQIFAPRMPPMSQNPPGLFHPSPRNEEQRSVGLLGHQGLRLRRYRIWAASRRKTDEGRN
jgi:hypothetical protein